MHRIDAHQHFWNYDPVRDAWITEQMQIIRRDFLPQHAALLLKQNGFDGCVAVQADQSEAETIFLLESADEYDFIKGVVGWVDLQSPKLKRRLEHFSRFEKLKGLRHILQGDVRRDLMLSEPFKKGIALLNKYQLTYDILIFPDQLLYAKQLVSEFPDQKFVIDHLAKPYIKFRKMEEWRQDIKTIAAFENVYCKLSGFVTEADWHNWKKEDFYPYFDVVVDAFGTNRIMFGSDWPVCLVAARYEEVVNIVTTYFSSFSKDEQAKFFGENAIGFYNLT